MASTDGENFNISFSKKKGISFLKDQAKIDLEIFLHKFEVKSSDFDSLFGDSRAS